MPKRCLVISLAISSIALASGCAQQPAVYVGSLPEAGYTALPKTGSGSVSGQLFLRTMGGYIKYGASSEVVMLAATTTGAVLRGNSQ